MAASKRRSTVRRRAGLRRPGVPYRYNRPVRDLEFVQRVRRHTSASVVRLVARYGAVFAEKVKSTRPTEPVRLGDSGVADAPGRILGDAVEQLNTSAALARSGHPGFGDVPCDRPMVGLAVTMEPFHTVNTPLLWTVT